MTCPICTKPTNPAYRPFCSKPCADRDLLNWLDGRYAVPAAEEERDEDIDFKMETSDFKEGH